nr:hypothetical protein HmN_000576700 [Hymenolepis microstoma]
MSTYNDENAQLWKRNSTENDHNVFTSKTNKVHGVEEITGQSCVAPNVNFVVSNVAGRPFHDSKRLGVRIHLKMMEETQ